MTTYSKSPPKITIDEADAPIRLLVDGNGVEYVEVSITDQSTVSARAEDVLTSGTITALAVLRREAVAWAAAHPKIGMTKDP